jgi:hypothetical protein
LVALCQFERRQHRRSEGDNICTAAADALIIAHANA